MEISPGKCFDKSKKQFLISVAADYKIDIHATGHCYIISVINYIIHTIHH